MWKKRLGAFALCSLLAVSLSVPALAEEAPAPDPAEGSAYQAAQYAAQYGGATAVSYALWEDGEITVAGNLGNYSRTENRAILADDLYGIGSVSKVYTAAAVMKLVEAGKLELDAPVTRYLPDFKMADSRYRDITVRMLLNHSSGLMSSTAGAFLFDDPEDRSATTELLDRLSKQRLKADPGAYSVYCNDGFTLAELVVEAASGQSFRDFLKTQLLERAGLEDTYTPQDEFDTDRLVKTYLGEDSRALPRETLGIVGCGGLYASASDLAAFGGALTGEGLLSRASLEAMAAPEYKNGLWPEDDADGLSYGLGWDAVKYYPFALSGIQALAKSGDTIRYHAGLVVLPEYKMAAAVLSSGGVSTYNQMAAARMLIDALAAKGVSVDETAPALPSAQPAAMPAQLTAYSGCYAATTQQLRVEITEDGVLSLRAMNYPDTPAQLFTYHDDGSFRDATGSALLRIEEKAGGVYLYQKGWGQLPGLGLAPASNYLAQKLPENPIPEDVQAAWDGYMTMSMLPISEKYTSQLLPQLLASETGATPPEMAPGYVGAVRIVDAARGEFFPQIPGNAGRDGQDLTVYTRDGLTYMEDSQGSLYVEAAAARPIYGGAGAYSTIQPDGYARWYRVGDLAGRTMGVTVPDNGGFYVYDGTGAMTGSSVLYGERSVVLPEDGYILFAGDPGARFYLEVE